MRRSKLRSIAWIGGGTAIIAVAAIACSGSEASPGKQAYVTWIPNETFTTMTGSGTPQQVLDGTPPPKSTPDGQVQGFAYPIVGGCLPQSDALMPGAPREYRAGLHEGVDFYDSDNCVPVGLGTPVIAAKSGAVVRADTYYQDLSAAELRTELAAAIASGGTDPQALDAFRGRQVWIEHPDGTVTRYAHLSRIAAGIETGATVAQGELVGYVGNSGTPESITAPGTEYHLHFEIRVGASYLGAGFDPADVRDLYEQAFSP